MNESVKKKEQIDNFLIFMDRNINIAPSEKDNTDNTIKYCKTKHGEIDRTVSFPDRINLDMPFKSSSDIESSIQPDSHMDSQSVKINMKIDTIDDLLLLMDKNPILSNVTYNINIKAIHNIKDDLIKLNTMVGMTSLKGNIIDQILYFVQDLHTFTNENDGDFLHTVIYGPPGTGKTEVAHIHC